MKKMCCQNLRKSVTPASVTISKKKGGMNPHKLISSSYLSTEIELRWHLDELLLLASVDFSHAKKMSKYIEIDCTDNRYFQS